MNEALKNFAEKVLDMRRLQKAYFQTRDKGILIASKVREKEVDETISSMLNMDDINHLQPQNEHPKLF